MPARRFTWPLLIATAVAFLGPVALLTTRPDLVRKVREVGIGRVIAKGWNRVRRQGLIATVKSVRAPGDVLAGSATLPYSIFDTLSMPPREDPAARAAMPEYIDVSGVDVSRLLASQAEARAFDTWHRSGGDELSSKYSSLDQITVQNVRFLEPARSYSSGSDLGDSTKIGGATVETNPVVVGTRMFLTNVDGDLIALDAETGKEIWRRALPAPVARRGLVWEPNDDFTRSAAEEIRNGKRSRGRGALGRYVGRCEAAHGLRLDRQSEARVHRHVASRKERLRLQRGRH